MTQPTFCGKMTGETVAVLTLEIFFFLIWTLLASRILLFPLR